jgi:putative hydrolase of the HAD superfamily
MKPSHWTKPIDLIAFDADDTLWHNETIFVNAQNEFKKLLKNYHSEEWIERRLYETEVRNLQHFGYGVKSFTLSMIETAIELSESRITGAEIQTVVELGKEMLRAPVELLEGVEECITELAKSYPLMVITKGDLFHQETKLFRSGLADHFTRVEIVSEKNRATYERIIRKCDVEPERFLMIGDSMRSDILPVIESGARAVHIPSQTTWLHERVPEVDLEKAQYVQLEHIRLLPPLLAELQATNGRI